MATATLTVREATPADVALASMPQDALPIARLIQESWEHTPFARTPKHSMLVQVGIIARFLATKTNVGFVLKSNDGAIVGYIAASMFENSFSLERVVSIMAWWVTPSARGRGLQLIDAVENWARERGAHELHCYAHTPYMERLCRGMGYDWYEACYMKVL